MKYCVKLNGEFYVKNYEELQKRRSYGSNEDGSYKGILYKKVSVFNIEDLMQVIPEKERKYFGVLIMKINMKIPPHTDSYIKSTINFYMKTENCITKFYEPRIENAKKRQIKNQKEGFLFDENDLIEVENFVAKPNEAWLLDVTKPHAVHPMGQIKERLAITLGTIKSYEEVYEMLKETNYV